MESRTLSRANGSCTNRRGWSKSLDTVITHDAKKNPSPPSTNWQDFLFNRRLFVNFLPLDDWIPVTPRSIIDHDQRLRPMEIPCRAISSPREERGPSLSLSVSAEEGGGGGGGGSSRVCVRLGDHPFSLPLRLHPV